MKNYKLIQKIQNKQMNYKEKNQVGKKDFIFY